jgi:UDP-N-acetylmuramate dehydrogenase
MDIKQNVKLSDFNTFRTGGNTRFFCKVESEGDLIKVLQFVKENKLEFFVIGNGSNLLVSDKGFNGLVIKMSIKGIDIESQNKNYSIVSSFAGESFDSLITFAIKNNLSGIENLWNIPGTVGAAAVQNIGAYGVEAKDNIFSVEGIDSKTLKKFNFKKEDCDFEYRDSLFKKNKNLIIIKVFFKLNNSFVPNLEYSSLKEFFKGRKNIDVKEVTKVVEDIRKNKLPDWKILGTAGSFFKNPIITEKKYCELVEKYANLPKYDAKTGFVKISLGFIIDKICGLKGYKIGQVGLYEKQSLVIVNYGGANFSDIDNFAKKIEEKIFEKIKIKVEREVENIF